jgi:hypothetical protein
MGFSFATIAISQPHTQATVSSFCKTFGLVPLVYVQEVNFEESASLNFEEDNWDFLFLTHGTLIFTSQPHAFERLMLQNGSIGGAVGAFVVEEHAMMMIVKYYENGVLKKELWENNLEPEKNLSSGFDIVYEDAFDLVTILIEKITGQSFWEIAPDTLLHRYRLA